MVSFQFCMILQTLSWYRSFSHLCYPREVMYIYKYLWDWFVRERPNHHQGCYGEFKFLHSQLFDNDDIHLLNMLSPFSKCFPLFLRLLHFFFSMHEECFSHSFSPTPSASFVKYYSGAKKGLSGVSGFVPHQKKSTPACLTWHTL